MKGAVPVAEAAAALTDALQGCLGVPVVLVLNKADALPSAAVPVAGAAVPAALLASRRGVPAPAPASTAANPQQAPTAAQAQALLRAEALRLGASVVFASARTQRNVDALIAALAAALGGTPLSARHQVYDYAATFVPAGWDSPRRLALDGADPARLLQTLDEEPGPEGGNYGAGCSLDDDGDDESAVSPATDSETCWSEEEFMQLFVFVFFFASTSIGLCVHFVVVFRNQRHKNRMVNALAEAPQPQPQTGGEERVAPVSASARVPGKTGKGAFGRSVRVGRASVRTPPTPVAVSPDTSAVLQ